MAKPYSMDLRERVIAAVLKEGQSRNQAAERFGVAVSTVIIWVRRFERTGSAAPGQMGGHKPRMIRDEHEAWLSERIQTHDFTLHGLVAELAARGLKVELRTVWSFVRSAGLTYKKRRWLPANGTALMSPAVALNG